MTLKSFSPGRRKVRSSSRLSSAITPNRLVILSLVLLQWEGKGGEGGGEGKGREGEGGGREASRDIVAENGEDSALVQKGGERGGGGSEASRDIVAENGEDSALVQKYGSSMETACSDMVCAPILVVTGVILSTSPFTTIHSLQH